AECLVLGPDPLGQSAVARDAGVELGNLAGRKVGLRLRPLISGKLELELEGAVEQALDGIGGKKLLNRNLAVNQHRAVGRRERVRHASEAPDGRCGGGTLDVA